MKLQWKLRHRSAPALPVLLLLRSQSRWPPLGEKVSTVHMAGASQDVLILQGKARLCNLALLLPHVETYRSGAVSPLRPSTGITLMAEGGLRGRSQDPEALCKAHMGDVLSQELCQETLNHTLVLSNPSPAPFQILGVP